VQPQHVLGRGGRNTARAFQTDQLCHLLRDVADRDLSRRGRY
jgi:hypothetical protein